MKYSVITISEHIYHFIANGGIPTAQINTEKLWEYIS